MSSTSVNQQKKTFQLIIWPNTFEAKCTIIPLTLFFSHVDINQVSAPQVSAQFKRQMLLDLLRNVFSGMKYPHFALPGWRYSIRACVGSNWFMERRCFIFRGGNTLESYISMYFDSDSDQLVISWHFSRTESVTCDVFKIYVLDFLNWWWKKRNLLGNFLDFWNFSRLLQPNELQFMAEIWVLKEGI